MPIDTDVQEVLDYIGARPVVNAANSTLDELRRDKEEIERDINALTNYYLNSPEELSDSRVSPILADYHSNLPPALIITAEYDPFCDDGFNYADKLKSSGVDVEYKCFEGVVHAFMSLAGGMSRGYEALDYTAEYLKETLT